MAKWRETGKVVGAIGKKAALGILKIPASPVLATNAMAVDRHERNWRPHLANAPWGAAAAHNQRWFRPKKPVWKMEDKVDSAKLVHAGTPPEKGEPSPAEAAEVARKEIREAAAAFGRQLAGKSEPKLPGPKPGPEPAPKPKPRPAPSAEEVANGKSLAAKGAATGFAPAAGGGASGRSFTDAVEVNRYAQAPGFDASRDGVGKGQDKKFGA